VIPFTPADLLIAWVADLLLGDPRSMARLHPVVFFGRIISAIERGLYKEGGSPRGLRARGAILFLLVSAIALAAGLGLPWLGNRIHHLLGHFASIWIAWTTLAARDLDRHVRRVLRLLEMERIDEARRAVGEIVGRDTDALDGPEVLRAAFETTAESTSDGIVAPLFYLGLGAALGLGPALALLYKGINTLDSMVGYRDERYEEFGKVSARADDVANWIPARLTAIFAAGAAQLLFGRGREAWRVARRDARLHDSPNSGWPEAAFAGGVGVQVGGVNRYGGVEKEGPLFGDPGGELRPAHVRRALKISWASALAALGSALLIVGWAVGAGGFPAR